MKQLLFLIVLITFVLANIGYAKNPSCFEVKYLDFFGLKDDFEVAWSNKELDELLESKFDREPFWMIPPIIFQLKIYHPNCNKELDKSRFDKLSKLYFKIRKKRELNQNDKPITEQLTVIREDFYQLLNNANILPLMRYSMDDGPLYGEITKTIPNMNIGKSISTSFGKVTVVNSKNKVFLIATNNKNKIIWSRIMTGAFASGYLRDLRFKEKPLEETPFATVVYLQAAERLTLYLKPDGKFICYFYSW